MLVNTAENKKVRIRTCDIPTSWLNARCRNLISKYALLAFRHDGTVFDLRSEQLLSKLSKHARMTEPQELQGIYQELKNELRAIVAEPSLKTAVSIMAEKLRFLENGAAQ